MQPILHDLLSQWQDHPEAAPEELCRDHPELLPLLPRARRLVVVEASDGQLEDELRLALSHAEVRHPRVESLRRFGGALPGEREIVEAVLAGERVPSAEVSA